MSDPRSGEPACNSAIGKSSPSELLPAALGPPAAPTTLVGPSRRPARCRLDLPVSFVLLDEAVERRQGRERRRCERATGMRVDETAEPVTQFPRPGRHGTRRVVGYHRDFAHTMAKLTG